MTNAVTATATRPYTSASGSRPNVRARQSQVMAPIQSAGTSSRSRSRQLLARRRTPRTTASIVWPTYRRGRSSRWTCEKDLTLSASTCGSWSRAGHQRRADRTEAVAERRHRGSDGRVRR